MLPSGGPRSRETQGKSVGEDAGRPIPTRASHARHRDGTLTLLRPRPVAWLVLPAPALASVSPPASRTVSEASSSSGFLSWAAGLRVFRECGLGWWWRCLCSHWVLVWDLKQGPRGLHVALTGVCGPGGGEPGPWPGGCGASGRVSPGRPCVVPTSLPGVSERSVGPPPGRTSHTWPSVHFRAWASVSLVKGTLKISSLR